MRFWGNDMAKRYNYSDIAFIANRAVFFDANILLYIFWPTGSPSWEKKYSSIFRKLLTQKDTMVVDFIVISEVVNRAIKTEYEKPLQEKNISRKDLCFKPFRDSRDGPEALHDIYQIVNKKLLINSTLPAKFLPGRIERISCRLIR
jgi:predicted nucleic acid-binding protein